ncbi:TPA: hypothetical protein DEO28_03650 [Candidatus Dependentiae bacterium]|nr:MAG: hypothetical protein UR14_C0007G0031 [candidate division TM6 bacterium GW2011_GWE2_31_21]KKP53608.1 MAG: hypothetical protein UR43_C0004G0149 [candidate division TM6 bacterium GW2011_GWF2_33_332]HBS48152.1 hypothetical protein [Candidatus Dependentiae bacterium]HBZ73576.1 hypothetical protein [Candidatus Dependentiae bacterium]
MKIKNLALIIVAWGCFELTSIFAGGGFWARPWQRDNSYVIESSLAMERATAIRNNNIDHLRDRVQAFESKVAHLTLSSRSEGISVGSEYKLEGNTILGEIATFENENIVTLEIVQMDPINFLNVAQQERIRALKAKVEAILQHLSNQ